MINSGEGEHSRDGPPLCAEHANQEVARLDLAGACRGSGASFEGSLCRGAQAKVPGGIDGRVW